MGRQMSQPFTLAEGLNAIKPILQGKPGDRRDRVRPGRRQGKRFSRRRTTGDRVADRHRLANLLHGRFPQPQAAFGRLKRLIAMPEAARDFLLGDRSLYRGQPHLRQHQQEHQTDQQHRPGLPHLDTALHGHCPYPSRFRSAATTL